MPIKVYTYISPSLYGIWTKYITDLPAFFRNLSVAVAAFIALVRCSDMFSVAPGQ